MKNTIVINLIAGQGCGKSTTMAGVFEELKHRKIDCEMVTEYAKELVWENRGDTFKDELYIFAKQNHRLFRCNGKVDVIITDRPIIMTIAYNNFYSDGNSSWNNNLNSLVYETFSKYNNYNFVLNRVKEYNKNGRNESEEQAKEFDSLFRNMLDEYNINYEVLDGDRNAKFIIADKIVNILGGSNEI